MILKKALEYISEKGYIKVDEISQELGIPKGLAEHVIQELKEKEYLRVTAPINEESAWSFCLHRVSCHVETAKVIKFYVLTEKGKGLLAPNENKNKISGGHG